MLKISSKSTHGTYRYKFASVTFRLQDASKVSQPKDALQLSHDLHSWVLKNVPRQLQTPIAEPITSDGNDYNQASGIINWYFPDNLDPERLKPFVEKAIQEVLIPLGVNVGNIYTNKSSMYENMNVWRIPVVENNTTKLEQFPELNLTNRNFEVLCDLLKIPRNWIGSITAVELKFRVKNSRQRVKNFTQTEYAVHPEDNRIHHKDFGLKDYQLLYYLDQLDLIATRAMQSDINNRTIVWS